MARKKKRQKEKKKQRCSRLGYGLDFDEASARGRAGGCTVAISISISVPSLAVTCIRTHQMDSLVFDMHMHTTHTHDTNIIRLHRPTPNTVRVYYKIHRLHGGNIFFCLGHVFLLNCFYILHILSTSYRVLGWRGRTFSSRKEWRSLQAK